MSDTTQPGDEKPNLMHQISAANTRWTRVNSVEAFPGVAKPLAWDFFGVGSHLAWRGMLTEFGVLAPDEHLPDRADEEYMGLFYGRVSANVDNMAAVIGLFPGDGASDHAREIFSENIGTSLSKTEIRDIDQDKYESYRNNVGAIVEREHRELLTWWQQQVAPDTRADEANAVARYRDAYDRFVSAMTNHCGNSTVCQQVFSAVRRFTEELGKPALAAKLSIGLGDTFDTRSMLSLWRVGQAEISIEDYLGDFGFQCSFGDDMSAQSWRENPQSLIALVKKYAEMDPSSSPLTREHERAEERRAAEAEILAMLPLQQQDIARALFADLRQATRRRELGKASYKIALDAGRAAVRAHGRVLAKLGAIEAPADIFFLTQAEAFDNPAADCRQLVRDRKALYERYAAMDIPVAWIGNPQPTLREETSRDSSPIKGLGASPGVVEGRVCLVLDHSEADDMEPGEILVARTTDPSWGPFFVAAGGLVIDIGGQMSHGAIIARELGVPCVINTGDGTRRLAHGDRVRVDGNSGEVTVLEPADTHSRCG